MSMGTFQLLEVTSCCVPESPRSGMLSGTSSVALYGGIISSTG